VGESKLVRHDPHATAKIIMELATRFRDGKATNRLAKVAPAPQP
jgi:hypothetical protein